MFVHVCSTAVTGNMPTGKKLTGKMPTEKAHRKNTHREKCSQGKMPTRKNAHRVKWLQGKMPTMKNAHMYNRFKIDTGNSAFVKNSAKTEGNITKTSYLNKNA